MILLALVGAVATAVWSRRLLKRRKDLPLRTRVIDTLVAASAIVGAFGTVIGLVKTFGAVGGVSVDPSQKARLLSEGISEAVNATAFASFVWLPSVFLLLFITRKRSERPE